MSSTAVLDLLRALARAPGAFFWATLAWLLDRLRHLDPLYAGLVAILLVLVAAGLAWFLQRRLGKEIERAVDGDPAAGLSASLRFGQMAWLELSHSPILLPLKPFQLLIRGVRALGRGIAWLWRKVFRRGQSTEVEPADSAPVTPRLVATLGPSLLTGAAITAALYGLALATDPLLAARWRLSEGLSAWQFLVFGHRPELAWYLPLDRFPHLAALLALLFWLAVWSVTATVVRLVRWRSLASNLHLHRDDPETLPIWRRWAGVRDLWRPAPPYLAWAKGPVLASLPLLAWAWLALAGDPYRLPPGAFAVAVVLWTGWGLHLVLRGVDRDDETTEDEREEQERSPGWEDVLALLASRYQIAAPEPFPRHLALPLDLPPDRAAGDAAGNGLLSPLVGELLGWAIGQVPGIERAATRSADKTADAAGSTVRLTSMQREVLQVLALQGYVHVDPPSAGDQLALGRPEQEALQDRSGLRSRNQVVLAPEGSGKTTLALLAVANHALVHTRASLVVTSTPERAKRLYDQFRDAVEPSTLRWNLRLRRPGSDLMNDLSRGILPDVVITDLHDLVVTLLDRTDAFAGFLRTVGLIVVDDVESFAGAPEVHAQLAFRRLILRLDELTGTEELGGRDLASPQVLILGTESMHETSEWAQSLCGVDAVLRPYGRELDGASDDGTTNDGPGSPSPAQHCVHRLRDFRTATGELLALEDLVAACEQVGVPWHYRSCGDGRRDLGRGPLLLEEEPRHAVDSPAEACVLVLQGTWSEVRRERRRLVRAGLRFAARRRLPDAPDTPEPIAVVTVAEPELEMAFTQIDQRFALVPVLQSLPRPVLRPPTGRAVRPHLAAELTQHWTEVGDVVKIFGAPSSRILKRLGGEHLLLAEERRDVDPKADRYARKVYVQALSRAVEAPADGSAGPVADAILPPKVAQVAMVSPESVEIRDRTSLAVLGRTDAASADILYYPGRIFEDARGRFVVVGRSDEEADTISGVRVVHTRAAILVEPFLADSISSPRRRLSVSAMKGEEPEDLRQAAGGAFFEPERTLFGRFPVGIALQAVRITVDHAASYRLGPTHCEVRQRSMLDSETRRRIGSVPLETVALAILPNPEPDEPEEDGLPTEEGTDEAPLLDLAGARVLAATMRAVLPSLYRGGAESVGVALHLDPAGIDHPERDETSEADGDREIAELGSDRMLGPGEGIYLFDVDSGGNGAARAIYRDGLDLLLRLCRLTLERVLPLTRLRALHDEWGTRADVLTEARRDPSEEEGIEATAERRRLEDQALRKSVLAWLDSRLQPEGGAESQHELERYFKSGSEESGQLVDLGRCWYSEDGAATDLVWVKHRWHRPEEGEAMLDVAFDRKTVARTRSLLEADFSNRRAELNGLITGDPDNVLRDSIFRGRPSPARVREPGGSGTRRASVDAGTSVFADLQLRQWAFALDARPALRKLAEHLADAASKSASSADAATFLCRFVQGIPNANRRDETEGVPLPAPPVWTLLGRSGNSASQALLLAVLLDLHGLPTGVFASATEGRVLGAVPVDDVSELGLYGELPPPKSRTGEAPIRFAPVDTAHYGGPRETVIREPDSWVFVPLPTVSEPPETPEPGPDTHGADESGGDDDA